jgi:hypothetical protein
MLHHLGYLFAVVVACRYVIPSELVDKSRLSELKDTFEAAVAQTVLEHPLLHVGLVGEGSKQPSWAELRQIDLSKHIQWRDSESSRNTYHSVIPSQLDSQFDDLENRPGWRVTVLHDLENRQLEVIFAWNHANVDGISGKIFHKRFLQNLNALEQGAKLAALDNHTLILPPLVGNARFPPPQEHTAKYTITPGFLLSSAWKEMKRSLPITKPKTTTQATWAPIRTSPFATRVRGFSTTKKDTVQKLLATCRKHHTTLTGLFHALILVSLASQLGSGATPAFAGGTALNMRRFSSSPPPDQADQMMANFVSDVRHHFDPKETAEIREALATSPGDTAAVWDVVWRIAARVHGEIQAKLDAGTRDDIIGLMRFVGDWRQTITGQARKPRALSWNLSNIGVLVSGDKNGEGGAWECERAVFALGGEVTGAAFNVGVISVQDKGLDVAVSWQACAVDDGIGEQLVADMDSWIKELAEL